MRTLAQVAAATAVIMLAAAAVTAGREPGQDEKAAMAAAMERAKRFTQPGPNHKILERFLGRWNTQTRFFMGERASAPDTATAGFAWLIPGCWLRGDVCGRMMGRASQAYYVMGYDNF